MVAAADPPLAVPDPLPRVDDPLPLIVVVAGPPRPLVAAAPPLPAGVVLFGTDPEAVVVGYFGFEAFAAPLVAEAGVAIELPPVLAVEPVVPDVVCFVVEDPGGCFVVVDEAGVDFAVVIVVGPLLAVPPLFPPPLPGMMCWFKKSRKAGMSTYVMGCSLQQRAWWS